MLKSFRTFEFRDGRIERTRCQFETVQQALLVLTGDSLLADRGCVFAPTTLVVKANTPSQKGRTHQVTHIHTRLEKVYPDVVFVAAMEAEEFERLAREADAIKDALNQRTTGEIATAQKITRANVAWEEIPVSTRSRITIDKNGCWMWKGVDAPYIRIYRQTKGPIPDGAHLRHNCDKGPHCVNPNHLTLGTHIDNNRDMLDRGRHWRQQIAHARQVKFEQSTSWVDYDALWTEEFLERAEALSKRKYTSAQIAAEFGNGITAKSVAGRLYHRKLEKRRAAQYAAYLRRKAARS